MEIPVQAFTTRYNRRVPALHNEVFIAPAFEPKDLKHTVPNQKKFIAVWDTGATNTCISPKVVAECALRPIGMAQVHTAGGITSTNVYLISISLPNHVGIMNVRVSEGHLSGGIDVLIGMDVIGLGDFSVSNLNGNTTLSFRMPSVEETDYVEQTKTNPKKAIGKVQDGSVFRHSPSVKRRSPKIGRNAPCPCGSGKKYKKCCGR